LGKWSCHGEKKKNSAVEYVKKINIEIKKHDLYEFGMMVQVAPKHIRPSGYIEVIKMRNLSTVLSHALNVVDNNYECEV